MSDFLQFLTENAGWAYIFVFAICFVQAMGIPLPSLTVALGAAALAGNGVLEFIPCLVAVILGGSLGGCVGYKIGQRGGPPILQQIAKRFNLQQDRMDAVVEGFQERGNFLLLGSRFVPILPSFAGIICGAVGMKFPRFFLFNFLGMTAWALAEMTLAFLFGSAIKDWVQGISIGLVLVVLIGVGGMIWFIVYLRRRRAAKAAAELQSIADS